MVNDIVVAELCSRLERVEAQLEISELASRYAYAADSRDIDTLVGLFAPGGDFGPWGENRDELATFFDRALRRFYRSMHQITGQVIDLHLPDRATGTVYCRAEHEDGERWITMAICYFDTYVRSDGHWYFGKRLLRHWYSSDVRERPEGPTYQDWPGHEDHVPGLPSSFPKWAEFWSRSDSAEIGRLTRTR